MRSPGIGDGDGDRLPGKMRSPARENAIGLWRRGTAIDIFRLIPICYRCRAPTIVIVYWLSLARSPAHRKCDRSRKCRGTASIIIGKNEKCNYRRAPAAGAQTRSPARENAIAHRKCDRDLTPGHGNR
ncbi:MAG: hypothetical protein EBE86_028280 [Hormoscilla sp. GUM202]|nr:hypothetical protein [Hormoscilla sp. GUM202]